MHEDHDIIMPVAVRPVWSAADDPAGIVTINGFQP
jgi:hypothetical protein